MILLHESKTIHANSVGCIIMVLLVILDDICALDTYLIDRPWHNVMSVSIVYLLRCMERKGMYEINVIQSIFAPVFHAKDIPLSITMIDFYTLTHIEFHFFTVDVQDHILVDLSYRTHPTWTVLECIYASCCLPILFEPLCKNDRIYTDGGHICNCSLHELINYENIIIEDRNRIVCISIDNCSKSKKNFTFIGYMMMKLLSNTINQNTYLKYVKDVHFIHVEQTLTLLEFNRVFIFHRKKKIDRWWRV